MSTSKVVSPIITVEFGHGAGLGHGAQQHAGIGLARAVIGGLERHEPRGQAVPVEHLHEAAPSFAGRDAKQITSTLERIERRRGAGEQRRLELRQDEAVAIGVAVTVRHALRVGPGRRQAPHRLDQGQADHPADGACVGRAEPFGHEGGDHGRHDNALAVDQRSVTIEDGKAICSPAHALPPSLAASLARNRASIVYPPSPVHTCQSGSARLVDEQRKSARSRALRQGAMPPGWPANHARSFLAIWATGVSQPAGK